VSVDAVLKQNYSLIDSDSSIEASQPVISFFNAPIRASIRLLEVQKGRSRGKFTLVGKRSMSILIAGYGGRFSRRIAGNGGFCKYGYGN
jgi:hypothetical protein